MKTLFSSLIIIALLTSWAFSDSTFDELVSRMNKGMTSIQLDELKNKYKGTDISGTGYVYNLNLEGFTVYLTATVDPDKLTPTVKIEVPENSSYIDIAKNLNKGQEISFSGTLDDIYTNTISIRGDVSISPE